jgi:hypothetical protein
VRACMSANCLNWLSMEKLLRLGGDAFGVANVRVRAACLYTHIFINICFVHGFTTPLHHNTSHAIAQNL